MKSRTFKKVLWITLIVVVLAGAGGYGYYRWRQAQVSDTQTSTLQTATVRQGDLILRATGTGTLVPVTEADLGFRSGGQLTSVFVKVGDRVEAGQLLAQLDDSSQQTKLAQAKQTLLELTSPAAIAAAQQSVALAQKNVYNAQVALNNLNIGVNEALLINAEASLTLALRQEERAQEAYDKVAHMSHDESQWANAYQALYAAQQQRKTAQYYVNLYSAKPIQRQIDEAEANLALAEARLVESQNFLAALTGGEVPADATGTGLAQLNQAKLNVQTAQDDLEATRLFATFSGTVMAVNAQVGESVGSGVIITIADLSQANIVFYMDESDWNNIKPGFVAEVIFDALPDQVFTGKVIQVEPRLVTVQMSSLVQGLIQLDQPFTDLQLPIGVSAAVDVISGQALNAVLVPVEALRELSPGQYAVFVMENGKPILRKVEVGLQDLTFAEIKSGLKAGEVVSTGIVETNQ